jgi:heme O synthase-like polyprenyltransferase
VRRVLVVLAGLALVTAMAFASNPGADRHQAAIQAAVAERSPVAGALGIGALAAFASTYESWGVASATTINDRAVTIGAFGWVHVRALMPEAK